MLSHVVFVPVTLEVDPAFPERLPCFGNLIALKAKDLPGLEDSKWKGKHFDGFYILARVDPRWYKDDDQSEHYTCRLLSESELAVKVPSWDYDIMYNRDEVDDMTKESPPKWVEPGVLHAIDNAQSTTPEPDSHQRKYLYYKLVFPSPIKLSGEVLHKGFEEHCSFPIGGKIAFVSGSYYIFFKVARTDIEFFKKGKRETKGKKKSAGAALFETDDAMNEDNGGDEF